MLDDDAQPFAVTPYWLGWPYLLFGCVAALPFLLAATPPYHP